MCESLGGQRVDNEVELIMGKYIKRGRGRERESDGGGDGGDDGGGVVERKRECSINLVCLFTLLFYL